MSEEFVARPWICQPTKLGLKTGQLLGSAKDVATAATWHVSLSWGFIGLYTTEGSLVSSIELQGSIIEVDGGQIKISHRSGAEAFFTPSSELELREWVLAIGALMQVYQSHWKDHEIIPAFETLAARATQLSSISKTVNQQATSTKLSQTALDVMVSFMWNSTKRQEKIAKSMAAFIQAIKTLIQAGCPDFITDSFGQSARQVVALTSLPFPIAEAREGVEIKPLTFTTTVKSPSGTVVSSIVSSTKNSNSSTSPSSSEATSPHSGNARESSPPVASSTSSGSSTPTSARASSNVTPTSDSNTVSPVAGRRAGSHSSLAEAVGRVSPSIPAEVLDAAETQQETILRLVKDIRSQFVRSVEAFKSLSTKNFETTVTSAETAFVQLKHSFDAMIAPLESLTVVHRLKETPERYYVCWKKAVEIVREAFAASDRNVAMTRLREQLPIVGDAMGQASHVLCGAVFEAAQQVFAEQELKVAAALFTDTNTSRIAQFLAQHPNPLTGSTDSVPTASPRQHHHSPHPFTRSLSSPRFDELRETGRKTLISAQAMVRICRSSFLDALAHEDHTKHLSILERLIAVVDKMISDMEANEGLPEPEKSTYLEVAFSTRDFGKVASAIIEGVSEIDANDLQTISPQQAMKTLSQRRGSTQTLNSKLNVQQMRFSSATKQLCHDLDRLLDILAGAEDESKLDASTLRARRQSYAPVATSTRFIIHSTSPEENGQVVGLSTSPPLSSGLTMPLSPRDSATSSNQLGGSSIVSFSAASSSPRTSEVVGGPTTTTTTTTTTSSPSVLSHSSPGNATSPTTREASLSTWSEKVRPKNIFRVDETSPKVPPLSTSTLSSSGFGSSSLSPAAQQQQQSPNMSSSPPSSSPGDTSPRSVNSPDSSLWRKSVKARDDPISPRTSGGSGSPAMVVNGVTISSGATGSSSPTSDRPMIKLLVRGIEIEYPETVNLWLEPEEGNFKYLKGSELENEHSASVSAGSGPGSSSSANTVHFAASASAATLSTSPPTSPPTSASARSMHLKSQSTMSLTRSHEVDSSASSSGAPLSGGALRPGHHVKTDSDDHLIGSGKAPLSHSQSSFLKPLSSSTSLGLSQGSGNSSGAVQSGSSIHARRRSEPLLASATLNKLIVKLTHESTVDVAFLKSFLATYRSFTTPEELWGKLLERYNVPPKPSDSPLSDEAYKQHVTLPIHLRVANVIGMWLSTNWQDISPKLMVHLEHFAEETIAKGEARGLQKKLKSSIEKAHADKKFLEIQENAKFGRVRAGHERARAFRQVMVNARIARLDPHRFFLEEETEPHMIAEQLSALDWAFYSKITHLELLNKGWSREDNKNLSPNVRGMIQRFNEVSSWVATNILWQETMDSRVKVFSKVIQTAHCLFKLNNFNATLAIISGLNNAAIHRLKFTFAEVPKKERAVLTLLMEKMSSKGSYKEYRMLLKRVSPPKIPYLGVYLTDLTFIEDGNPNNIGHLINFHKRRLVHRVLQDVEQYQDTAYNIPSDPRLAFILGKLSFVDDNELYNLSLLREPRGAERTDIR